jgi:hypothetical protein
MKPTLLLILLTATATVASARLGENRQQLVTRYGEPLEYGGSTFFSRGFLVIISGWHYGNAGSISYSKQRTQQAEPEPISANAIRILLDANGPGWTQTADNKWESPDAIASYDPSALMLYIHSRAYLAWRKEQSTQHENTSMQGL